MDFFRHITLKLLSVFPSEYILSAFDVTVLSSCVNISAWLMHWHEIVAKVLLMFYDTRAALGSISYGEMTVKS